MIYRFQIYIYFVNYFKNHGVMVERRSGEVAVPLSAKKNFKRVVPIDMQTAVIEGQYFGGTNTRSEDNPTQIQK